MQEKKKIQENYIKPLLAAFDNPLQIQWYRLDLEAALQVEFLLPLPFYLEFI